MRAVRALYNSRFGHNGRGQSNVRLRLTGATTTLDQKVLKINEYKVYKVFNTQSLYNTQMVKVFSVQKKTMKFWDF